MYTLLCPSNKIEEFKYDVKEIILANMDNSIIINVIKNTISIYSNKTILLKYYKNESDNLRFGITTTDLTDVLMFRCEFYDRDIHYITTVQRNIQRNGKIKFEKLDGMSLYNFVMEK